MRLDMVLHFKNVLFFLFTQMSCFFIFFYLHNDFETFYFQIWFENNFSIQINFAFRLDLAICGEDE